MYGVSDPLVTFWAPPKGWAHFSGSTRSAHSLSSRPRMLHSTAAVLGAGVSQMLGSLLQLGCTFTNSLSSSWCQASASRQWPLQSWASTAAWATPSKWLPLASQSQASAAPHDPFMPSEPVPFGWLLPNLTASTRDNLDHLWSTACGADSKEILFRKRYLGNGGLFLFAANFLAPTDQHNCSSKAKIYFSGSGLLLTTAVSSALVNQNHIFPTQYQMTLITSLRGSQTSLGDLTSQVSVVCTALGNLVFHAPHNSSANFKHSEAFLTQNPMSFFIMEESWGRNSSRAGTWRQELM